MARQRRLPSPYPLPVYSDDLERASAAGDIQPAINLQLDPSNTPIYIYNSAFGDEYFPTYQAVLPRVQLLAGAVGVSGSEILRLDASVSWSRVPELALVPLPPTPPDPSLRLSATALCRATRFSSRFAQPLRAGFPRSIIWSITWTRSGPSRW